LVSAVLLVNKPASTPNLVPDLPAAGILLMAALETGHKLVQAALRHQPDVLICDVPKPDRALWQTLQRCGKWGWRCRCFLTCCWCSDYCFCRDEHNAPSRLKAISQREQPSNLSGAI
jgi:hypothetical protein